jgi:hypothetical protein
LVLLGWGGGIQKMESMTEDLPDEKIYAPPILISKKSREGAPRVPIEAVIATSDLIL